MSTKLETQNSKPKTVLLFAVAEHDQGEWQRLPQDVRDDVDRLLVEFEKVNEARFVLPALKEVAGRLDHKRGFKFGSLREKFYLYVNGGEKHERQYEPGDWRCLVDWAKCSKSQRGDDSERDVNLPRDFVEYLKGLFQSNKRKSQPAIRLLYRQWRAGESIPGYGTWQEWFLDTHPFYPLPAECPPDMPAGWSRGNLRRYIPEDADLALAREGIAAARNHLPDVLTTREGLRPLEVIMFDDVRTDFKILVPGYASPVEINLLVALDVATGMILRFGLRPALPREDGKKDHLKLQDMKTMIAGILTMFGVPKHYKTTYVVENATAAIKEGTEMALREQSCDRIEVSRTMMINGTAIWGGYKDKTFGNPRGKAHLESTFNLLHNEAAFAPGQTGRRYDQGPAELQGRIDETKSLQRTSKFLTPHDRVRLKMPFLNRDQARVYLEDIFRQIMTRDDHQMEGFKLFGEWREKPFEPWRPDYELSTLDSQPSAIEWRNPARRETPLERWERLTKEVGGPSAFSKLHPGAVMRLYDDHAPKEIIGSEIIFKFDGEKFVYRIANVQHARQPLQNEMRVLCYFDREDMSVIHITDGDGAYLGTIPRTRGARRFDKAAIQEQFQAQRKALHELQDRVSARMPQVAEEHLAENANNIEVITDALDKHEAIDMAPPTNGSGTLPATDSANRIGDVIRDEKTRVREEAARSKALRSFKGDVGELAESSVTEAGQSEMENGRIEELTAPSTQPQHTTEDFSADALL
jgi:hypothetical protein